MSGGAAAGGGLVGTALPTGGIGDAGATTLSELEHSVAFTWNMITSFLMISMQLGFAMLEVGSVREAHRMTVLVKNVMDAAVSCLGFWAYIHWGNDALVLDDGNKSYTMMLSQWAFCATCVTICSGSMAERAHVLSYLCFAAVMAGIIYPVMATSVWSSGGLLHKEFHGRFNDHMHHDFAGGGVVHLAGGCAALIGSSFLGRRIVRPFSLRLQARSPSHAHVRRGGSGELTGSTHSTTFRDLEEQEERRIVMVRPSGGWQRRFDDAQHDVSEFGTCTYLQVMGMFTLWVGWYGFNAGSTRCMRRECSTAAGVVAWNTTLAACAGGVGAYLYSYSVHKNLHSGFLCNGVFSGLVAITAACDVATEGAALTIGLIAGLIIYPLASQGIRHALLDDPVDAIAVHFFCGLFGVLAVAFCRPDCEALERLGGGMEEQVRFCQPGHSMTKQLIAQAWGLFTEIWWTTSLTTLLWLIFAVSELARSLESKFFDQAHELISQMVTGTPSPDVQAQIAHNWVTVANGSPIARAVLRRHGWKGQQFVNGVPDDIWLLRSELQRARGEKIETCLEVETWLPLLCLARCLHSCNVLRSLALLRLRIAPVSEICGLGAADLDGGQLFGVLQKAVTQLTEAQREHSPLKHEVRELALAVQSQESVLNAIVRKSRRGANGGNNRGFWQRRSCESPSVPPVQERDERSEGGSSDGESTPPAAAQTNMALGLANFQAARGSPQPDAAPTAPAGAPLVQLVGASMDGSPLMQGRAIATIGSGGGSGGAPPYQGGLGMHSSSSFSGSTDRTVSDGALTPRSANEDTPPPSVLGRQAGSYRQRAGSGGSVGAPDTSVQEVASQLMTMLSAQQTLLSALQSASSSPAAGGGTPTSASGPNAMLMSALQQVAAGGTGAATPDSPATPDGRGVAGPMHLLSAASSPTTWRTQV